MRRGIHSRILALVITASCSCMAIAQADGDITWRMAFLKGGPVKAEPADLSKPIEMKSGDAFQLFLQVVDSEAYVYVLFSSLDGTVSVLARQAVEVNGALTLPSPEGTFTVTPPSGTERLYVVVSAARQEKLEKLLSKKKPDSEAILDEVRRVQRSTSLMTEIPQKPVPLGGVFRGGNEDLEATQFEGKNTYVQILRLVH